MNIYLAHIVIGLVIAFFVWAFYDDIKTKDFILCRLVLLIAAMGGFIAMLVLSLDTLKTYYFK